MSACHLCCPWNLPLTRNDSLIVGTAARTPMHYEEWIAYHQHVVLHQKDGYGGQMDDMIAQLKQPKEVTTNG